MNKYLRSLPSIAKMHCNRLYRKMVYERCDQTLPYIWDKLPRRSDLINAIIEQINGTSYLEIGCRSNECLSQIRCLNKIGVDPVSGGTLRVTSDEYFTQCTETFDVVFIDGLHLYEQVTRDMQNALACLKPRGIVLVHDCLPLNVGAQSRRVEQVGFWNGDVWKAFLAQRTCTDLDSAVCEIDHGIGMIVKRQNSQPLQLGAINFQNLRYADFAKNYQQWMNLKDFDEAVRFATTPLTDAAA